MGQDTFLTERELKETVFGTNSQNDGIRTAEIYNEFTVVPNNVSIFRDVLVGNGTVDFTDQYEVSTPAQTDGNQSLETSRIGQYRPGSNALAGIYVQKENPPVGVAEWGYGRDPYDDGAWFRYNSDGSLELVVVENQQEIVIPRNLWSESINERTVQGDQGNDAGEVWGHDSMDGSGDSGVDLDPADGYIYHIEFAWYGAGPVTFGIVGVDDDGYQFYHPILTYEPNGTAPFNQPNHPIFARIDNDGTATADNLRVGGRQFSTFGDFESRARETEHLVENFSVPTASYEPVVAIRRGNNEYQGIDFDLQALQAQTDNTLSFKIELDPTFNTAPSWTTPSGHDASETGAQVADAPDANDDGTKYSGFLGGAGKNQQSFAESEQRKFPFPRQIPVVIYARSLENAATLNLSIIINEKW